MIITRDRGPTLVITASRILNIAPPQVTPVDTVGAGDAFARALTVACASGMPVKEAIHFANAAGALATRGMGHSLRFRGAMRFLRSWVANREHDVTLGM